MGNLSGQSICRRCRREGTKLFLKGERCEGAKCAFTRRSYPPGMHGQSGSRRRLSGFGRQLREKQKAKAIYGVTERQLKNYYSEIITKNDVSIISMLERRLDNVVYRLGLSPSRKAARQLVSHSLLTVNNKRVSIPSFQVRDGDVVAIKPGKEKSAIFSNISANLKRMSLPAWLSFDLKSMTGKVLAIPKADQIDTAIEESLIIEYYSR